MLINQIAKLPPQSIEQEKAVLGSILINPEAYTRVNEILTPEVFYSEDNKIIYKYIKGMTSDGVGIDLITLTEAIRKGGELEQVGGVYYISTLTNGVSGIKNVKEYAKSLFEKFLKRRLIAICDDYKAKAYKDTTDGLKVAQELTNDVFEALSGIAESSQLTNLENMVLVRPMVSKHCQWMPQLSASSIQ
jgi:replicative DNA helicase